MESTCTDLHTGHFSCPEVVPLCEDEDDLHTGRVAVKSKGLLGIVTDVFGTTDRLLQKLESSNLRTSEISNMLIGKMSSIVDSTDFEHMLNKQDDVSVMMRSIVAYDIKLVQQISNIVNNHAERSLSHFKSEKSSFFDDGQQNELIKLYTDSVDHLSSCRFGLTKLEVFMRNTVNKKIKEIEDMRMKEEEEQKDIGKQVQKHAQKVVDAVGEQGKRAWNFFRGTNGNFYSGGGEIYCCARCRKRISYL